MARLFSEGGHTGHPSFCWQGPGCATCYFGISHKGHNRIPVMGAAPRSKLAPDIQGGYNEQGEKIHTEISRKYDDEVMIEILEETDFRIIDELTDSKRFFIDYILEIQ